MGIWRRMVDSIAFRLGYVASDAVHVAEFESLEARQSRYIQNWAWYENQAYSRVHNWAKTYRHQHALYKHIRSLYNPSYRLGSFYAAHLFGGALDPEAAEAGAIPIATENEALRPAIAELWKRSNMSVLKDVVALRGAIEGDVFLRVEDDWEKQRVYLSRLDPGVVTECDFDVWGNVKGYTVEYDRPRPGSKSGTVKFKVIVSRDGDLTVTRTFKGNSPYGWDGRPAVWTAPYTFIPLVLIKHHDVGLDWGWSELHPLTSKVHDADELASMIHDHIRRHLKERWFGKGIPEGALSVTGADVDETGETDTRPQPGREELRIVTTSSENASLEPLITDLNIEHSLATLNSQLEEIERDFPELQADIWAAGGDTSGRALRIARQRVESKALQRREGYDNGLMRVQMMAIAIGGMRGYAGYEGFNIESYERGALDHTIAPRPIFEPDPMDANEEADAFWEAAGKATGAGMSLKGYLREMGWSDERIAKAKIEEMAGPQGGPEEEEVNEDD